MRKYCVGFMFSEDLSKVALIRKTKPAWQAGRLNGIGGKLEEGEDGMTAMRREFLEEAGVLSDWDYFLTLASPAAKCDEDGGAWEVDFFFTIGELDQLRSMTTEEVEIHEVSSLGHRSDLMENIEWTVPMAKESKRTKITGKVIYP